MASAASSPAGTPRRVSRRNSKRRTFSASPMSRRASVSSLNSDGSRSRTSSRNRRSGITRNQFLQKINGFVFKNEVSEAMIWMKSVLKREVSRSDISDGRRLNWVDVQMCDNRLKLFYKLQPGDEVMITSIYETYQNILDAIAKATKEKHVDDWPMHLTEAESEARAMLGYLLAKYTGNLGEALEHCRLSLKLDPHSCEANAVYGYILDRYFDQNLEARAYLERALELDERNAFVHSWYAMLLANEDVLQANYESETETDREFSPGLSDFDPLGEGQPLTRETTDPQHPNQDFEFIPDAIVHVQNEEDIYFSVDTHFQKSIQLQPNWSTMYVNFGMHKIDEKKFDEARVLLLKAVELDSMNVVAASNAAWVCSLPEIEEYDRARDIWELLISTQPNDANAYANLARLNAHAFDNYPVAKRLYLTALTKSDDNPHVHFFFATLCRHGLKDEDGAHRFMKQAFDHPVEISPFSADSYLQQGRLLSQRGKHEWAEDVLRRGMTINQDLAEEFLLELEICQDRKLRDKDTLLPTTSSLPNVETEPSEFLRGPMGSRSMGTPRMGSQRKSMTPDALDRSDMEATMAHMMGGGAFGGAFGGSMSVPSP